MDAPSFVRQSLQQVHLRLQASIEGVSEEQARWRPIPGSNSIGFLLWHVGRVEDDLVSAEAGQETLWDARWAQRFGQPPDTPSREERETLLALEMPSLAALREFLAETYARCEDFVGPLSESDLDRPSRVWPGQPMAVSLRHLVTHKNNHHGQVDFLRGLQDQAWNLPTGTGVVLDDETARRS